MEEDRLVTAAADGEERAFEQTEKVEIQSSRGPLSERQKGLMYHRILGFQEWDFYISKISLQGLSQL